MSIHSSLAKKGFGQRHRNVLKRFERVAKLIETDVWDNDTSSALKLPKHKSIKLKK